MIAPHKCQGWCLALLLVTLNAAEQQHGAIKLSISPKRCIVSCDVRIDVRIEPHPDNRWWTVELDGPVFRSSTQQLNGEQSPKTQAPMWINRLPMGSYEVRAILYRDVAQEHEAARAITKLVIGDDPNDPI